MIVPTCNDLCSACGAHFGSEPHADDCPNRIDREEWDREAERLGNAQHEAVLTVARFARCFDDEIERGLLANGEKELAGELRHHLDEWTRRSDALLRHVLELNRRA